MKKFLSSLFGRGSGEGGQASSFDAPKKQEEVDLASVTADTEKLSAPEKNIPLFGIYPMFIKMPSLLN
jgi:hypothetical protein